MRTVQVSTESTPVSYINRQGDEQVFGHVAVDTFEEEGIRQIIFNPTADNRWANQQKKARGYRLGIGSSNLAITNPADVHRELLSGGFEIRDQFAGSGGLRLSTMFIDPSKKWRDPINWDHAFWRDRSEIDEVFYGVKVDTNLEVGRMAVSISPGIYRLICTNGLVGRLVGYDSLTYRHIEWDQLKSGDILNDLPEILAPPVGVPVATPATMSSVASLLRTYRETPSDPRFEGLSNEFIPVGRQTMTGSVFEDYLTNLELVSSEKGSSGESVTSLDLMTAYTSSINVRRINNPDLRGSWTMFSATEAVVDMTIRLAKFASIFSTN